MIVIVKSLVLINNFRSKARRRIEYAKFQKLFKEYSEVLTKVSLLDDKHRPTQTI